jgi:hypothetical protein
VTVIGYYPAMFDETTDAYCEDYTLTHCVGGKNAEFLKVTASGTYSYHWALKETYHNFKLEVYV